MAKRLNIKLVDINKVARQSRLLEDDNEKGFKPDIPKLKKALAKDLEDGSAVVFGHLLPAVLSRKQVDLVVVLRCSPFVLMERYQTRGYGEKKAKDNAAAEILDLILADAVRAFGKSLVAEIDSTNRTPEDVLEEIVNAFGKKNLRKQGVVDWLTPLAEEGKLNIFFGFR